MRITGGKAKSRRLITPKTACKGNIRPTSDRVREALFSILGGRVAGARILDLFAGTGSFGLDALSRGAKHVVFADASSQALQLVYRNLQKCFSKHPAQTVRLNLTKPSAYSLLEKRFPDLIPFDIIFLDPPYGKKFAETSLTMLEKTGLVAANSLVIAEERWKVTLPERIESLQLILQRRYGETGIWIYGKPSQTPHLHVIASTSGEGL